MSLPRSHLYYREDTSDKVYLCEIVEVIGGYAVDFAYGRRGAKLAGGTKTSGPVSYEKAEAVYSKIVREKINKGYRASLSTGSSQPKVINRSTSVSSYANKIVDDDFIRALEL